MPKITQTKTKGLILKTALIFLSAYIIFLILWIQVKDYYGYAITYIASNLTMAVKDSEFKEIKTTKNEDILEATFRRYTYRREMLIGIPVKTSAYTFNAPLTFAIMAAFYSFIKRKKRAYVEVILILITVHILYVFSLETKSLTEVFMGKGFDPVSMPRLAIYQFLWSFTDNMIIRFEPFLIGFYLFLRFKGH